MYGRDIKIHKRVERNLMSKEMSLDLYILRQLGVLE